MESNPLQMRRVLASERCQAFLNDHRKAGFSPEQVVFLAEQHYTFDRQSLRLFAPGRRTLLDLADSGVQRLRKALAGVRTPEDLERYRTKMVETWAPDHWEFEPKDIEKVIAAVHRPGVYARIMEWASSAPLVPMDWDQAATALAPFFTRMELDLEAAPSLSPSRGLRELGSTARAAGIHTLSWNTWLYPAGEEGWLAQQLASVHAALTRLTGWEGPCVGLGGLNRLSLDDALQDSEGLLQSSPTWSRHQVGLNRAGLQRISLSPLGSWSVLGHEWIHSLDSALSGSIDLDSFDSELGGPTRAWVEKMEAVSQPLDDTRQWLESHRAKMLDWAARIVATAPVYVEYAQRVERVYQALDAGQPIPSVSAAYHQVLPSDYLDTWSERLAYGYDRASTCLGALPVSQSGSDPLAKGTPAEQQQAAEALRGWLASPEVKACWDDLSRLPQASSLLDGLARRRLERARRPSPEAPLSSPAPSLPGSPLSTP